MRILNIFLVLNIVICYGGLCGDNARSAAPSNIAQESCHKMDHENSPTENPDTVIEGTSNEDGHDAYCCYDALINSSSGEYSKVNLSITLVMPITHLYAEKYESVKSSQDRLTSDHDPPDLRVSYSTFLL